MIIILIIIGSIGCGLWAIARHGNRDRGRCSLQPTFRSLSGVGRPLSAMLLVLGGLSAAELVLQLTELYTLQNIDSVTGQRTAIDSLLQGVASFYLLAFVPTVVLFLSWFYRAYLNLEPSERRWRPKWAIRGWFIPVGNLVIPFQIANDIWRSGRQKGRPNAPATIAGWWFSWLGSGVLSWVGLLLQGSSGTVYGARVASAVLLVSEVLAVWSAGLAWIFVTSVTEAQGRSSAQPVEQEWASRGPRPAIQEG